MRSIFSLSLLLYFSSFSQTFEVNNNVGVTTGLVVSLGTHSTKLGLKFQGYINQEFFQINAGNTIQFSFYTVGQRKKTIENRLNIGFVGAFGNNNNEKFFTLDGLYHQTSRDFAVGYNFLFYKDNSASSQRSGGFSFHYKLLSVLAENDLFAGEGRDRFRTGGLQIAYQYQNLNFKANTYLWTGETRGAQIYHKKEKMYKSLNELPYGKTSHGIIKIGVDYLLNFGQIAHLAFGFDSERWRYHLQNNVVHNASKKSRYYYPYLNKLGNPESSKKNARKTTLYLNSGINNEIFY